MFKDMAGSPGQVSEAVDGEPAPGSRQPAQTEDLHAGSPSDRSLLNRSGVFRLLKNLFESVFPFKK